ncbi:2-hydroxychromene-2-carboxylate isomerase [Aliirhizobium cellulosilyticum]|jgi:2-hydroxychromene-2-carboxylate isomerase|uniref:2-hydroxychromene-2-carboxylate isomerase n=1 Tax=Aliirhizobium cellulosilyticum TaxID=393664 RepID=A0A7W6SAF3_9HYPH|nr:2-hydroxychromene-2-carboxylate isomerase [Rhizobium cellulosilyticum]MBB4350186.1 2-hydroxychromene-2-carboxylate isomerase [Rhizobium cellulosilyticum]MBB4413364.1 2-hydroxychromene-2-carboxylate isomerase [Rhizobium cellulosilyticum]MBB4447697.1 2-hydroxychromene-2-carboxylate isomerase [Rhizobium cellulosilyticum]
MRKTVYYYHALSSPWAYLGWPQFKALIEKHDLDVVVRPTRIVTENGGVPLRSRPQPRQDYHAVELDRWRKRLNMPLVLKPKYYPTNNEFSARMVIAADRLGLPSLELSHALLHALWSEELDVTQPDVRIDVANRLGLDGAKLQAMENQPEIMQAWLDSHEEAGKRGVFGTPTWIYKDVLYWGQDRLDFLDEALSQD